MRLLLESSIVVLAVASSIVVPINGQPGSIDPQPEDFAEFVDLILDENQPLPSCETVGVQEVLGCNALCKAIGDSIVPQQSRDINGDFLCACETQFGCSDRPSCSQLTIQPGEVESSCASICGDRFMAFEDFIEYAGSPDTANKDQTHFVLECRCDGVVECSDYLLFSDVAVPQTCDGVEVTSEETCGSFCTSESGGLFDGVSNFTVTDGIATCFCEGTDTVPDEEVVRQVQACTDESLPDAPEACTLKDPCPTSAPTAVGEEPSEPGSAASSRSMIEFAVLALGMMVMAWGV